MRLSERLRRKSTVNAHYEFMLTFQSLDPLKEAGDADHGYRVGGANLSKEMTDEERQSIIWDLLRDIKVKGMRFTMADGLSWIPKNSQITFISIVEVDADSVKALEDD
jgi:hypothetical protein